MDGKTLTREYLAHLREQREAALVEAHREHGGLVQALAQNQARQQALAGQLTLLDELLRTLTIPDPSAPPAE